MLVGVAGLLLQLQLPPQPGAALDLRSWRFHPGDDPAWAAGSDDSDWDTMSVSRMFTPREGADGGFGWYRLRFTIAAPVDAPLGLSFESVVGAFEVFVDGARLGGAGEFPPRYRGRAGIPLVVAIPVRFHEPGEHVVAVRVFSGEGRGGIAGRVTLGSFESLRRDARRLDYFFLAAAILLLGIGLHQFFFWLRRPMLREHLWILGVCAALAVFFIAWMPSARIALDPLLYYRRIVLACASAAAAFYCFAVRRLFDLDDDRLVFSVAIAYLLLVPAAILLQGWSQLQIMSSYVFNPLLLLGAVVTLWVAATQLRSGSRYASILLWGGAALALTVVHGMLVDLDLVRTGPTTVWITILGALGFVASMALSTAEKFVDSETASLYDRLTGLYRREVVLDALSREIRRSARLRQPLSVIMLDLDKFKQINDTLGHQTGDRVLAEVGRRMVEAGRAVDWLGRYGGEEFIGVLATTDVEGARLAAERLRRAVSALPIATGRTARTITMSAGVAAYNGGEEWPTTEQLVGAADAALYRAKNAGRDRVMD